ncbi:MAG: DUF362 domain-containing protein [Bacteroidota bacterium]
MDRRNFLDSTLKTGLAIGSIMAVNPVGTLLAGQTDYDLVAVKGGNPDAMFDKAIASLGGMKRYVKQGQTVVVKPNIGWDVTPERAGNTNPLLVKRIIEHCYNAGAKKVYVFDNTCDNWEKCYTNSGIERAVKDAGGRIVSGSNENKYHEVEVKYGKVLTKAKVHELILESNVFINVPILKHHSSAKLTISMKNLMGIVWDRRFWHSHNLHQCIADMATWRKPDLNIVDAYNVLRKNGPRGVSKADVENMKSLLISKDMVVIDAAATKLFGMEPDDIPYIKIAHDMKVGNKDLSKLNINRIKM